MKRIFSGLLLLALLIPACTSSRKAPLSSSSSPLVSSSPGPLVSSSPGLLVSPSPRLPATPSTALPVPPSSASATPRPRAVLVSFDGGRADFVRDWMASGLLPHFAALAGRGVQAEYAQSVDPSLTATAHNSMSTGAYPSRTGIVSNAFHDSSDSFYWYRQGFDELIDQGEPVWVTASKAGLTSAAVFFPGGSPAHPGQMADYTIGYGVQDAYSKQVKVKVAPAAEPWPGEAASYSPPYEGDFTIPEVAHLYLLLLDTTDDGQAGYDTVLLNTARQADTGALRLGLRQWGAQVLLPVKVAGGEFLIQEIDPGPAPRAVTLFYTGIFHNTAAPRELQEALNAKFGFFPAGPDSYAMEHGWITPEDNLHLMERQARWMAQVAAWVYTEYAPDLLLTWQDNFDAGLHAFLMVDERQTGYTPARAEEYAGYLQRAAATCDEALAILLDAIDLDQAALLLAADHGMAPIHTTVYVNTLLEQAGLLKLDSKNYVVVDETRAFAVASGGGVHVYINLLGREKAGTVPEPEYAQVQAQVIAALQAAADPDTGEPIFARVVPRDQLAALHLDHPHSGDVFAQAVPGYHLDGYRGYDDAYVPAPFMGQHGYDSALPEMRPFFLAAGAGVPPTGETIPPVSILDYAPTLAALLGFAPSPASDGEIISIFRK